MTPDPREPERYDWQKIVAEIEASGFSLYKIALRMQRRYTQIKRIKDTGRCQHHEGEMILAIHREIVPHETSQNVTHAVENGGDNG